MKQVGARIQLVWELLEPVVSVEGVHLFDLEVPSGDGGVLRVYITKPGGILVDDCARVSRAIRARDEEGNFLPGDFALEVSSPGVNRKLSREEHFRGAQGERVRLTVKSEGQKVVQGILERYENGTVHVKEEGTGAMRSIPFGDVVKAQVDFLFPRV